MIVRSIILRGFTVHEQTEFKLPAAGVTLVTGPNGSGKSSVIEGVAWSLWGKTLRGTNPIGDKGGASVEVSIGDRKLAVARTRSGNRSHLEWSDDRFESMTKAQGGLEGIIGELDAWRRTHVFSSQDAAGFAAASDADRKRLLEDVLGLARFDSAHRLARDACKAADAATALSERRVHEVSAQLQAGHASLFQRRQALEQHTPVAPDEVELEGLRERYRALDAGLIALRTQAADLSRKVGLAEGTLRATRDRIAAVGAPACYACKRPWDDAEQKQAARTDLETLAAAQEATVKILRDKLQVTSDQGRRYRADHDAMGARMRFLEDVKAAFVGATDLAEKLRLAEREAAAAVLDLEDALDLARAEHEARVRTAAHHAAVEDVLGTRGVRAHLLGRALGGLEVAANAWLERISSSARPLRLRLAPITERKGGTVSDVIALEVDGAGGGLGYRASSGGERRRIDVALLLALSEVASGMSGRRGTLWFDEVFDALDTEGLAAVAGALEELASDRNVVVVSHSLELAAHLRPVSHIRMEHQP